MHKTCDLMNPWVKSFANGCEVYKNALMESENRVKCMAVAVNCIEE